MLKQFQLAVMLIPWMALSACATSYQARSVEKSGFLGDYSEFREGKSGEALLVYRNPTRDLRKYDKMIVDPVVIWRNEDLADVSQEDLQMLANLLHAAVVDELGKDYKIVEAAGPGVLRLRGAITEAKGSSVVLDVISTVMPIGLAVSGLKQLITGTASFVGAASVEAELLDSVTGERLMAAVDRRVGGKSPSGVTRSWSDVESAYDHWGEALAKRLRTERLQLEK